MIFEVIVIDDHSTDDTYKIVNSLKKKYQIRLYSKKGKTGKAYSLLEGFGYARFNLLAMIDADLQYAPENLPGMVEKIDDSVGIVVAERNLNNINPIRKILSQGFSFIFARLLHGLNHDVQSGLKVFKKEIIERISLNPGPWSFDLEFLVKAKHAGYKIDNHQIIFEKRQKEQAKISLLPAILEIGYSALKLKFSDHLPTHFHRRTEKKKGKGFHFGGLEFIHHSDLPYFESAFRTLVVNQKLILLNLFLILVIGFIANWLITAIILVGIFTFIYFLDLLLNLFLVMRGFTKKPEIRVLRQEVEKLNEEKLPKYTILCPLYQEWEILPQFVTAMSRIDYPTDKLQVLLLLEEDDRESINHAQSYNLPDYFEIVVVPDSLPKTKPKALNYGLQRARGEYLVIYDAEDIPDPQQLKKVIAAFEKAGAKTVCIQAKLNFYNPHHNILTRIFTAEYSLWFDLVLTGLQSIFAPIPLGGTSNHFRLKDIKRLNGWDSFNVTEDCDLGMRLAKRGYQTALINSVTLEEANSDLKNWFAQRTRWIKGYIQTYLVHMRSPRQFLKNVSNFHLFIFQLVVGGKVLSMFINPLMWITTISYFVFRPITGSFIQQFFPPLILYMGVFSLVFGNFLYMYYYMIGCVKRGQYDLVKYVYLVPFYWLCMSIAAWKAVFQLIRRPHFWPKTIHGYHYDDEKAYKQATEMIKKKLIDKSIALVPVRVAPAFVKAKKSNLFEKWDLKGIADRFPKRYFFVSIISVILTAAFLTLDVILVKVFFPPTIASEYTFLALIGRMIFFLVSFPGIFFIPFGFNIVLTATALLAGAIYFSLSMSGSFLLTLIFGSKTLLVFPYLQIYSLAMALFAITNSIVSYHLAKKQYLLSAVSFFMITLTSLLIVVLHKTVGEVVLILLIGSDISLGVIIVLHLQGKNARFFLKNIIDLIGLLLPLPKSAPARSSGKRILIYNWRDLKHKFAGGAEVYIHELAKRWVKAGNQVTLFCGNDGNCIRNEIKDGVRIIRRGGFYFVYFWAFVYYFLRFRGQYDVIIDSENGIPFFTPLYAGERKYLLIHHVHQEIFRKSLVPPLSWIAEFLELKFMPFVYRNIKTITVSPSSKKEIIEKQLTKIEPIIIYNGIDLKKYKPAGKSKSPLILYLGRLQYYKSLHIFIYAAKNILEKMPEVRFVIAGDGEEKNGLIKLAKKIGIFDAIGFIGKVSEKEKIRLYQKAWIFVNPSFMEGWGITTIEANACGTPVVASNVPGLRDSVNNPHNGLLVPYGSINEFTVNIIKLLKDNNLRTKMSSDAVRWAKMFDWQTSADKSLELFK